MDTETADVVGHDVTTITCVCGNTVRKNGLIQANSQSVPVYIGDNTPVPAELAAWPADEDLYTLCPSCGRVTATRSSKIQQPRPSLFSIDVAAGPIAEAIRAHWNLKPRNGAGEWTDSRRRDPPPSSAGVGCRNPAAPTSRRRMRGRRR